MAVDQKESVFFADQFENLTNFRAQYEGTSPEMSEQCAGNLEALVASAGTGGKVAGATRFLPGVMYIEEEAEGKRLKNPFVTEAIGINRLMQNFTMAKLDGAFQGTDKESVEMSRYLVKNDLPLSGEFFGYELR